MEGYALSGVMLRSSNIKKDLRLLGYEIYSILDLGISQGSKGDCLDRYLIRVNESLECIKIISQLFQQFNIYKKEFHHISLNKFIMESMIVQFRFIFILVHGFTYLRQEAPKGELGLYIVTDNRNKIYRIKIRSPDYYNLQAFNIISHNHLVADLISIVGTSDFVLGSVDRNNPYFCYNEQFLSSSCYTCIFLLVNIPDILNCPT